MHGSRVDAPTQPFRPRRRDALKAFLGVVLGVPLAASTGSRAAADCKKVGQNCDSTGDCCRGAQCRGGECTCRSGRDECGGKCFVLDRDERHCGACNTACAAGLTCCDGGCTDLQRDRGHCASCAAACLADQICLEGGCIACPIGNQVCGDVCCPPFQSCFAGACVNNPA